MPPIYHMEHPEYDGITLTCVDPRFIKATRQFLRDSGLSAPFAIELAGGAHELAQVSSDTSKRLHEIIRVLSGKLKVQPPRIVLVNHEDCAWCKHCGEGTLEHSAEDLRTAFGILHHDMPQAEIDCYLAKISSDKTIEFERLEF